MRLGPAPDGGRSPGAAGAAGSVPSRRGGSGSPGPVKVTFNGGGAARPEGVGGGREGPAFPRLRVPAAARSSGRRPGRAGGRRGLPGPPRAWNLGVGLGRSAGEAAPCRAGSRALRIDPAQSRPCSRSAAGRDPGHEAWR